MDEEEFMFNHTIYTKSQLVSLIQVTPDLLKHQAYITFSKEGIGTGKAMLKEKAPACWEYLCKRLKEEFDYDNRQNQVNS